jgi:photosystem II stability/assembly factor-like uncharacterized protein
VSRTQLLPLSAAAFALAAIFSLPSTPPVEPQLLSALTWRNLGPFRAGRVAAVSGAIGQPGVFYIGAPAGGVWKTTSAGETWYPIFDSVTAVASIGAVEVAPSDPNIIYVGTGDMITGGGISEGNGVYKSTDAGKTWQHLGLDETKQIPSILVDPNDPNVVLIAAQGDVHKKTDIRGVYRSADGGKSWTKTLYVDDETGIQKLARAFDVPNVIFATTVRHYTAPGIPPRPGAGGPPADNGPTGTALYKSTDGGQTWKEITGSGLPRLAGRTSVAVAMHTNAQRVFIITNTGLWRSDDGGATWRQMDAEDERIRNGQGGYNCGVYVDPKNPDVVYTVNTASYKSTDGGNTFTGFKGAPGGDDPQQMWIDPTNGQRMLFGYDQGAIVSLDGGATWSSWYNQSTEQMYHLAIDNSSPYWIYATQQDAGAIRTRIRGNLGAITPMDWSPVPTWEWGTVVPDPLDPSIIYASGNGIVKVSYPSEQWISVSPAADPSLELRTTNSQPLVWAPWNQHELLAGFQYVMATTDGGQHWRKLGPDLTIPPGTPAPAPNAAPANGGGFRPPGGAIERIAASPVAAGVIWVGTNNGLIKVTRDEGKTWTDASIPGLPNAARALVSGLDASPHNAGTAYAAIDLHTTGDYNPYLYRTRDYGKTWTKIVTDLPATQPSGSFARVIREDTKKAGLLFAGTESSFYVSFDDGDHWQPLMAGLPNTSFRDIAIKGNDLVICTYGRGLWVLDDFSMLRQLTPNVASEPAHLFKPGDALRIRRNVGADTPFPPEVPHALNPLDGVIIDYTLASAPNGDVSLDVLDASGAVVRHLSSAAPEPVAEAARPPEPNFWLAPPLVLPAKVGANRVNWDLRYDAPPAFTHSYEINANPGLTPVSPEGPLALPGTYMIRLTVNGRAYTQTVNVRNDPRSPATAAALTAQHALLMKLTRGLHTTWDAYQQASALREAAEAAAAGNAPAEVKSAVNAFVSEIDSVAGDAKGRRGFRGGGRGRGAAAPTFVSLNGSMVSQLEAQDNGDLAPTPAILAGWAKTCGDLHKAVTTWQRLGTTGLTTINAALSRNQINPLASPSRTLAVPEC